MFKSKQKQKCFEISDVIVLCILLDFKTSITKIIDIFFIAIGFYSDLTICNQTI